MFGQGLHGMVGQSMAGLGKARPGEVYKVWLGLARRGMVRLGEARFTGRGVDRQGLAGQGRTRDTE